MSRPLLIRRLAILLFVPLLMSSACNTSGGTPPDSQPEIVTIQQDVVYGSGPFNLPDPRAGLSDLSSYQAALTLSFDGTRNGAAEKWTETYVMLAQKDPATRQLTIEKSGDLTDLDLVFMAEADGTGYERIGSNACGASRIASGNSLSDRLEPAGLLSSVVGADEAGSETINEVAATHYTFDQDALGLLGLTESAGEMWVASEGGYVVKYVLTTQGKADYFGGGLEGTLSFDYEVTGANQPVTIVLPEDCPPGMVDAPLLPDAANLVNVPGLTSYETSTSLVDAVAFYQEQIPGLGWTPQGEPTLTETDAFLIFLQGDKVMTVLITSGDANTEIRLTLGRQQELQIP